MVLTQINHISRRRSSSSTSRLYLACGSIVVALGMLRGQWGLKKGIFPVVVFLFFVVVWFIHVRVRVDSQPRGSLGRRAWMPIRGRMDTWNGRRLVRNWLIIIILLTTTIATPITAW